MGTKTGHLAIKYEFTITIGEKTKIYTDVELGEFAESIGLNRIAPERYSWLFALQLLLNTEARELNPTMVVDELRALEDGTKFSATKPATQFSREPLKGLWHKHYFQARFLPQNILNQLSGGRLKAEIAQIFDPEKNSIITAELINELSHEVVTKTFEERNSAKSLTGEWIIFAKAKAKNKNYYLTLANHKTGDQIIHEMIKSVCYYQFPFLAQEA